MKKILFLMFISVLVSFTVSAQTLYPTENEKSNSKKEKSSSNKEELPQENESTLRKHMEQFSASYTPTTCIVKTDYKDYKIDFKGVHLGWIENVILSKNSPLYLQFGWSFQYLWGENDNKNKYSLLNATIPLNLSYVIRFKNSKVFLEPFAGFNAKINISASVDNDSMFDSDKFNNTAKRLQCGYQVGLGIGLSKFYINAAYQGDITEFTKDDKFKGFVIGLGYKF